MCGFACGKCRLRRHAAFSLPFPIALSETPLMAESVDSPAARHARRFRRFLLRRKRPLPYGAQLLPPPRGAHRSSDFIGTARTAALPSLRLLRKRRVRPARRLCRMPADLCRVQPSCCLRQRRKCELQYTPKNGIKLY